MSEVNGTGAMRAPAKGARERRRREAEERQAIRDRRAPWEQIVLLMSRPGKSQKEIARLEVAS